MGTINRNSVCKENPPVDTSVWLLQGLSQGPSCKYTAVNTPCCAHALGLVLNCSCAQRRSSSAKDESPNSNASIKRVKKGAG